MVNTDRGGIVGDRLPQVESKSVLRRYKIQKEHKISVLEKEIDALYDEVAVIREKLGITSTYRYYCPECNENLERIFHVGEQPMCLESFCEKTGKNAVCLLLLDVDE